MSLLVEPDAKIGIDMKVLIPGYKMSEDSLIGRKAIKLH